MILDEARLARERLARAHEASSSVDEAQQLSRKKDELRALCEKIQSLAERRRMLIDAGVQVSVPPNAEKAKQLCRTSLSKFVESPKTVTLVERQRWTKLTETLGDFSGAEESIQMQDWSTYYRNRLFAGTHPDQRERTILMSLAENREALIRYKRYYSHLNQYRARIPSSIAELNEVLTSSSQLSEIRFIENQDVPLVVREFLNAISTGNGADLELLTAEVVDWLRANGMISNFAVRAK